MGSKKHDLVDQIRMLHLTAQLKLARLEHLTEKVGPSIYPETVNRRVLLYFETGMLPGRCVGYCCDTDGEVIMQVVDRNADLLAYRKKDLVRYDKFTK